MVYAHLKMCIRWRNASFPFFTDFNDVKQGGANLTHSMYNISDQQVYDLSRAKHNFAMLTHTNAKLTFCIFYLSIIFMLVTLTS